MQLYGLITFALLLACVALSSAKGYEGFKIFEVTPATKAHVDLLNTLSENEAEFYDFFSLIRLPRHAVRVMIHPERQPEFLKLLSENAIAYRVVNENVQAGIEHEVRTQRLLRILKPYSFEQRLSTERYYSHNEINRYIEDLAIRFPKRAHVKTVGKSYEGRLLKTITISNGDGRRNKNVVLMDGGFHAREWISPAAAIYVIEQLVENFAANADLLLDYDWIVLPVVNPDGYEYTQLTAETRMWRKTRTPHQNGAEICIGTDPNRNFDFHWNEDGASSNPCANTFAGPKAFSEPETVVVRDLMHSVRGRGKMYLTLHSYGSLILYPWGWTTEQPDTVEDLHEVGQAGGDAIFAATGTNYTVGMSTIVLYVAAGASDDYAFNDGFPISFTMELPAGGSMGFDPPPSAIDSYVKETWIGIHAMAKKVVEKYPLQHK